jgi:hypothetical protein
MTGIEVLTSIPLRADNAVEMMGDACHWALSGHRQICRVSPLRRNGRWRKGAPGAGGNQGCSSVVSSTRLQIDPHGDNGHMGHKNRMKLPFRTSLDAAEQYLGRLQSRNYFAREFL